MYLWKSPEWYIVRWEIGFINHPCTVGVWLLLWRLPLGVEPWSNSVDAYGCFDSEVIHARQQKKTYINIQVIIYWTDSVMYYIPSAPILKAPQRPSLLRVYSYGAFLCDRCAYIFVLSRQVYMLRDNYRTLSPLSHSTPTSYLANIPPR